MSEESRTDARAQDQPIKVLVVSRDRLFAAGLVDLLRVAGVDARACGAEQLDDLVRSGSVDGVQGGGVCSEGRSAAAFLDALVVEVDGLSEDQRQMLDRACRVAPLMEVISISTLPEVSDAVEACRSGVYAVLQYPVSSEEFIRAVVGAGRRKRRAELRMRQLESEHGWKQGAKARPGLEAGARSRPDRPGADGPQGER
jgi:DNA-binding NtrC family response regulator